MRVPEFLRLRLRAWAHKKTQTPPDFIIRPQGRDQTLRWWVIPRNRFFNIYLHKFVLSDEDRALHDHPWWNCSILIDGRYIEWTPDSEAIKRNNQKVLNTRMGGGYQPFEFVGNAQHSRREGFVYFRRASQAHRVELYRHIGWHQNLIENKYPKYEPVITLFITGPKIREWGFLCPKGWRHWQDFCDSRDHGVIGRGCE